jgi:hypothetical protein
MLIHGGYTQNKGIVLAREKIVTLIQESKNKSRQSNVIWVGGGHILFFFESTVSNHQ